LLEAVEAVEGTPVVDLHSLVLLLTSFTDTQVRVVVAEVLEQVVQLFQWLTTV
jgi:hypothetical protein